jgi:hypothetical protein
MLFKSHYDAAAEAVDAPDEAVAEGPPAPQSEARRRLAKLLTERTEAESEAQRARDALARLQGAIASPGPLESQLAALDSDEASRIAAWSNAGGPFPTLDGERRHELEAALAECRTKAAGASRALPALQAEFMRASNKAAAIAGGVSAAIAEIVISEVELDFAAIVEAKASLAAMVARAESGRSVALSIAEGIPQPNRLAIAGEFYRSLGSLDGGIRVKAIANPPPSYDRGPWARLVADLASDASATIGGEG